MPPSACLDSPLFKMFIFGDKANEYKCTSNIAKMMLLGWHYELQVMKTV